MITFKWHPLASSATAPETLYLQIDIMMRSNPPPET